MSVQRVVTTTDASIDLAELGSLHEPFDLSKVPIEIQTCDVDKSPQMVSELNGDSHTEQTCFVAGHGHRYGTRSNTNQWDNVGDFECLARQKDKRYAAFSKTWSDKAVCGEQEEVAL